MYALRARLIAISVCRPFSTATAISLAVFFIASRPSTSGTSDRMSSGAFASRSSSWFSSPSSWILYWLNASCSATFCCSSSRRSSFTTFASSWSSSPFSVAMKFTIVHCAWISGL